MLIKSSLLKSQIPESTSFPRFGVIQLVRFPIADPATIHSALRSFTSGLISISLEHSQCSWDLVLSLDTFSLV